MSNDHQLVYLITSYPLNTWGDLPYRGIFVPLLTRVIHLAANKNFIAEPSVLAGESCTFAITQAQSGQDYFLNIPRTGKIKLIPDVRGEEIRFTTAPLTEPGNYSFLVDDIPIVTISVNLAQSKGIPVMQNFDKLQDVQIFTENDSFSQDVVSARFGSELWKIFIVLTLILLLLEYLLIKQSEGKEIKFTA